MKKLFGMILSLALTGLAGGLQAGPSVNEDMFEPIIEINLVQDAHVAASHGKHLMIMFVKDGCTPCIKMKVQVLGDSVVKRFFTKNFLNYNVNIYGDLPVIDHEGTEMTEKGYAKSEGIWGTPMFYFFGAHGQLVYKHAGALSKQEFIQLGEFISARQYQTYKSFRHAPEVSQAKHRM